MPAARTSVLTGLLCAGVGKFTELMILTLPAKWKQRHQPTAWLFEPKEAVSALQGEAARRSLLLGYDGPEPTVLEVRA